jgi:protein-tyrosine phosphatase
LGKNQTEKTAPTQEKRKENRLKTTLFWLEKKELGRVGICARPRGGDWLEDELKHFRKERVDVLVSALEQEEIKELSLEHEKMYSEQEGIEFFHYPIPDRKIPASMKFFSIFTKQLSEKAKEGKSVMIHCRQGIGRSSLICVGILQHLEKKKIIQQLAELSSIRGRDVPDTLEQIAWLEQWALSFL